VTHLNSFLKAVLGADAAGALKKAADRSDSLATVLGARTVVGWVGLASRWGYEGEVPGLPGSYLRFAKSEQGFEGQIRLGKNDYSFKGVDLPHVAAGLSVALGADQTPDEDLRDAELAALGQNIDLLLKTQVIKSEGEGDWDHHKPGSYQHSENVGDDCHGCRKPMAADTTIHTRGWEDDPEEALCDNCYSKSAAKSEPLDKFDAPGAAATQKKPSGPVDGGFTAPKATAPMRAKKKKFGTKLTMSQASAKCSVCDAPQFAGDVFVGCHCLKDLAKHASATAADGGFFVEFDPAFWSREDATLLLDIVGEGA